MTFRPPTLRPNQWVEYDSDSYRVKEQVRHRVKLWAGGKLFEVRRVDCTLVPSPMELAAEMKRIRSKDDPGEYREPEPLSAIELLFTVRNEVWK